MREQAHEIQIEVGLHCRTSSDSANASLVLGRIGPHQPDIGGSKHPCADFDRHAERIGEVKPQSLDHAGNRP
jgi:hypothetical protein